eukprot:1244595-Rhodomonas_salina.1
MLLARVDSNCTVGAEPPIRSRSVTMMVKFSAKEIEPGQVSVTAFRGALLPKPTSTYWAVMREPLSGTTLNSASSQLGSPTTEASVAVKVDVSSPVSVSRMNC